MMKTIVAGAIALTLACAGAALAQPTVGPVPGPDGPGARPEGPRWRPSPEDIAAMVDARIAALKAGLRLNAEQEKHWPAVEAVMRDLAKRRADRMKEFMDRMAARREARRGDTPPERPDVVERLRRRAEALTARAVSLKTLADASEPLYKTLDEGQKRRFVALLRMGGRDGRPGPAYWHRGPDRYR
jgi:hypothetical protein